jgi:hypothetical protein
MGTVGTETRKPAGPVRPAWEVYDFDVRYVDPHSAQTGEEKATRCVNLLVVHRGRFTTPLTLPANAQDCHAIIPCRS